MKFRDFLRKANDIAKKNPETLDMDVVYGTDDEGNEFKQVVYPPAAGRLDGGSFRADTKENPIKDINAVCVN